MAELNKMETKPMLPLIISMAVPPLISMFMQYTYNFVDCMFVSWLSEDALTAVSLAFPITTFMVAMSIGLGVGVNVLIARYLGQKNQDMADSVVSNGIILSAACGAVVTLVVLLIMKPFFCIIYRRPCYIRYGGGLYENMRVYGGCQYGAHLYPEDNSGHRQYDCAHVVSDCRSSA